MNKCTTRAFWFATISGSARPGDERDLRRLIEHARRAWPEAAARQHVLWGAPGSDLGEHRTAAGDADMGRVRQVELVVAEIEKQAVHVGPADHRDYSLRYAETGQSLRQRGAVRIPQQRMWMRGIVGKRLDPRGHDQPAPARRARPALVRMAALDDRRRLVEAVLKELLIGLDHHRVRDAPVGVGEHAVSRDDGVAFDADRARHAANVATSTRRDISIATTRR